MQLALLTCLATVLLAACAAGDGPERSGDPPKLGGDEIAAATSSGEVLLLDVREPHELEQHGTIEGYVNIPIGQLAERLDELPRDRPILTA